MNIRSGSRDKVVIMLTFELIERTAEYVKFFFYPEGNLRPGIVAFYPDGSREVISESEDDFDGYYSGHALSGILKLNKDKGTVAWC